MPRGKPKSRDVTVSKALSYLLRHAAEREGLQLNAQGYANVADVLSWRKLKSLKVTLPEIFTAVSESDKKRFALLHLPSESTPETPTAGAATSTPIIPTPNEETSTQKALSTTARADTNPSHFLIRATQGHSIKGIDASSYLEKLSLADEAALPKTVVHGTFHNAWPRIIESGGLKCMGRNHVHFATGPALEVVSPVATEDDDATTGAKVVSQEDGKVISGMRKDAQVLIYIDLRRALRAGCPFWRSENGVILSEGVENVVPSEFFDVVVERKLGLGRIWEGGRVVRELP